MVRLGRLTAWLLWNAALLLCALPFVGVGLLALIGLGVLVVWLAQGLPLAGAVLSCVGVLAVCAGALGLGSSLIWHRRRAVPVSQDPDGALSQPAAAQDERKKRGDLG